MNKKELKQKLQHYYEIDLNNCKMSHVNWINEITEAITNPKEYLKQFNKEYKEYLNNITQ